VQKSPARRLIRTIDQVSYWSGKSSAWLIVALMAVVSIEVFKRYILNAPTAWIFDLNNMLYGTLFMLAGAYTLAQGGHVRADFVYLYLRPRAQAALDLLLYLLFFLPGIAGLIYAGWSYAADSWRIGEHSTVTAEGPPIYHFKSIIPLAASLVLLQGLAEVVRCIECLRTGVWPERLADVEEIDVVEANSPIASSSTRSRASWRSVRRTRSTMRPGTAASWRRAAPQQAKPARPVQKLTRRQMSSEIPHE